MGQDRFLGGELGCGVLAGAVAGHEGGDLEAGQGQAQLPDVVTGDTPACCLQAVGCRPCVVGGPGRP